jgi:hypothetical protein
MGADHSGIEFCDDHHTRLDHLLPLGAAATHVALHGKDGSARRRAAPGLSQKKYVDWRRKFRRSSAAVATSREGHRTRRSGRAARLLRLDRGRSANAITVPKAKAC